MEITLKKIELVKDRTGVTYKEAKDALEAADGNVVDAIIAIEDSVDSQTSSKRIGAKGEAVLDTLKDVLKKGNVSRIRVTMDDEILLNIPVSAGIIGAVFGPWVVLIGVLASVGFKCQVSVIKDNGDVIDLTDKAGNIYEDAKVKGGEVADKIKEKAPDVYDTIVEMSGGAVNKAKDVALDAADKIKNVKGADEIFDDVYEQTSGKVDDALEATSNIVDDALDKVEELKGETEDKAAEEEKTEE
jgi:F0F1-type ATP synthase membrane subunit b/b'